MSEAVIVAIIAAAVGFATALPAIIKAVRDSDRQDEEQAIQEMSAVTILLDPLKQELADVRRRLNEEKRQVEEYRKQVRQLTELVNDMQNGLSRLIHQLQSHDIDPVWKLDRNED